MERVSYCFSIVTVLACFILLLINCHGAFEADDPGTVNSIITINGTVTDQANNQPLDSSLVEITSPSKYQQAAITDSAGTFSFEIEAGDSFSLTIAASKTNYDPLKREFTAKPGDDISGLNLALALAQDDSTNGNGENNQVKGAAAIVLTQQPKDFININKTGDEVSAPLTFQVQDSLGRPLSAEKAVDVKFKLVSSPGGGENLVPARATTDGQGRVTTTLFSGNKAGEIKIQASIERPGVGITIQSSPVLIAIHGGFPDKNHFSIAPDKHNFEGYNLNNNRDPISVVLGDQFSNPVKPGTVVYFETTGGIIQGSGKTDDDGIVTVDLIAGDPRPADGHATITASTVDKNNIRIQKKLDIVLSTSKAKISGSPKSFDLCTNGNSSFDYRVADLNGNPMPAGTQISIDAGNGIELTGDTNFTLGDFTQSGAGRTEFSFSIRDTDQASNDQADLTIRISVTTPSNNTTTYTGIKGIRC